MPDEDGDDAQRRLELQLHVDNLKASDQLIDDFVKLLPTMKDANLKDQVPIRCLQCEGAHYLLWCFKFCKLSPKQRFEFVKQHRLYLNCMKTDSHDCKARSSSGCRICGKLHHTLIHLPPLEPQPQWQSLGGQQLSSGQATTQADSAPAQDGLPHTSASGSSVSSSFLSVHEFTPAPSLATTSSQPPTNSSAVLATHSTKLPSERVRLCTVLVLFENCCGGKVVARILLDSGSQFNLKTGALYQKLKLPALPDHVKLGGVGKMATNVDKAVETIVSSRNSSFAKMMKFLVLPTISCNQPAQPLTTAVEWEIPSWVTLADLTFCTPGTIDALVGAGTFFDLLRYGKVTLGDHLPVLQNTILGWIVSGEFSDCHTDSAESRNCHLTQDQRLDELVARFWELEQCASSKCVSRGMDLRLLIDCLLWWDSPLWLNDAALPWPEPPEQLRQLREQDLERRRGAAYTIAQQETTNLLGRFSSFTTFLRIASLCRRFVYNLQRRAHNRQHPNQPPRQRLQGPVTVDELNETLDAVVHQVQHENFPTEVAALQAGRNVPRSSPLRYLNPELHAGIIRVGGRLKHAGIAADEKNPIVLTRKHPLAFLIAETTLRQQLHCGPQLLFANLRQRFWPLGGRVLVQTVVHSCVICVKARPRNLQQLMGSLPTVRITQAHVFENVGVDFAGPFYLRRSGPRAAPTKSYVSVFVCMATKACHLELVSELTIGTVSRRAVSRMCVLPVEVDPAQIAPSAGPVNDAGSTGSGSGSGNDDSTGSSGDLGLNNTTATAAGPA